MFSGKIQINNTQNELAGELFAQNEVQTEIPDFSLALPDSDGVDHWKGLFVSEDDDGPSFYFRGAVENNNVKFADMYYKIIRVNGDGSVRLMLNRGINNNTQFNEILADKYVGYTYDNDHNCIKESPCESNYSVADSSFIENYKNDNTRDSNIKKILETWYKDALTGYDDKIALTTFCNDTTITSSNIYSAYTRTSINHEPSLKCPNTSFDYGGVYKLKIGLITADELNMAGIGYSGVHQASQNNYLYPNSDMRQPFTMSPWKGNQVFCITKGSLDSHNLNSYYGVVPVINLNEDVKFSISNPELPPGTSDNPYIIE